MLLPDFYHRVSQQVDDFSLNIKPSQIPSVESLREGEVDLILTPAAPNAPDVMQKRLFTTQNGCFYDANVRSPPQSEEDFKQGRYISLTFMAGKNVFSETHPLFAIMDENVRVRVSNFSGLSEFLQGSDLLAIAPILMKSHQLKQFATVPLPYSSQPYTMYMLWHQRNQLDASHAWLREQLLATNKALFVD